MLDNLLKHYISGTNWVDAVFVLVAIYIVVTNAGFIVTSLDLMGFLFSLLFSLKTYSFLSETFVIHFAISKGLAKAIGFFVAWVFSESLFYTVARIATKKLTKVSKGINYALGAFPAILQALLLYTFILTLTITLPISGPIKKDVLASRIGPPLLAVSQRLESRLRPVFNDAILDTLHFLTIKPESTQSVNLGFNISEENLNADTVSEIEMFNLVNNERKALGLNALVFDDSLREVARDYAKEMFVHGFFSHTSASDGSSPTDRLDREDVAYLVAGENLAFTPDVKFAHTGLMNSPGHRKNILSPEFGKVGIGVIDGGTFNKIFVQEFTD